MASIIDVLLDWAEPPGNGRGWEGVELEGDEIHVPHWSAKMSVSSTLHDSTLI